jgi:hypothetical protein
MFPRRQYRDTRLTSLEKPELFSLQFWARDGCCSRFFRKSENADEKPTTKKAGMKAGLLQFTVEVVQ